jgi:hypothetical protein
MMAAAAVATGQQWERPGEAAFSAQRSQAPQSEKGRAIPRGTEEE